MPFSKEQVAWLEKTQSKSAAYVQAEDTLGQNNDDIQIYTDRINEIQDDLRTTSEALVIAFEGKRTLKNFFLSADKRNPTMRWMTGDRDEEIDTVHDLTGDYKAVDEVVRRLQTLHRELSEMSTEMADAKDADGNPRFSAKDIEREIWSPLVRADVIPSNAVPDEYSQEAQMFNGACEIYEQKLRDYTKGASRHPGIQRNLRLAMDTLSLGATLGGEIAKIARVDTSFISKSQLEEHEKDKDRLAGMTEGSPEYNSLNEKIEKFSAQRDAAKEAANAAKRDGLIIKGGVALFNGVLGVADLSLERVENEKKIGKVTEKIYSVVGDLGVTAFGAWAANVGAQSASDGGKENFLTMTAAVNSGLKAGLGAGHMAWRIGEAARAYVEGDAKAGEKAYKAIVAGVADAVANSFAAMDTQRGKDDAKEDVASSEGEWGKIGAYVKAAILAAGQASTSAVSFGKIVEKAAHGGSIDGAALAKALGLTAMEGVMIAGAGAAIGTHEMIGEDTRSERSTGGKDADHEGISWDRETGTEQDKRRAADPEKIAKNASDMKSLSELLQGIPKDFSVDLVAEKVKAAAEKQEAERKKAALNDFKAAMKDPAQKKAFLESIQERSEQETQELEDLIRNASPPVDDLSDPEAAQRAMDSIDKLIAEAAAANMKWKIIVGAATGITSIVASAMPVAGLAASVTRLAADVVILLKKSYHLNRWRKNLALTYGNSSVYGPAISSRLESAVVQVHHQSVKVIFDALGVTADSLKLADASGVGAAAGAVGHGIEIGNNMARALTEYGFKLHKEAEIKMGWAMYQKALANPGDRKLARQAIRWNSTLSKCVLAYGIVMDGDPIAKEVGRSCGLTPEVLADQKDVCPKVVKYFETLYSEDPKVLRRVPMKADWHPGTPSLTLKSWARFKSAGTIRANPPLHPDSPTPLIDQALINFAEVLGAAGDYPAKRDSEFSDPAAQTSAAFGTFLNQAETAADVLAEALKGFEPRTAPDDDNRCFVHDGFKEVVVALAAQADYVLGEIKFDKKEYILQTSNVAVGAGGDVDLLDDDDEDYDSDDEDYDDEDYDSDDEALVDENED